MAIGPDCEDGLRRPFGPGSLRCRWIIVCGKERPHVASGRGSARLINSFALSCFLIGSTEIIAASQRAAPLRNRASPPIVGACQRANFLMIDLCFLHRIRGGIVQGRVYDLFVITRLLVTSDKR